MTTFITLYKWTAQGVKNAKDTVTRYQKAEEQIEKLGGRVVNILWTLGRYDIITISEWSDAEAYTTFALMLGAQGNVQTETLRGFSAEDMSRILGKMG
jgi:uncharacterized protein with GYD domain